MTLRQGLGADVEPIYEQIDDLLDSDDAIIILADGHRALHYARGFGLSACQHELLAVEIDRRIRALTQAEHPKSANRSLNARSLEERRKEIRDVPENDNRTSGRQLRLASAIHRRE